MLILFKKNGVSMDLAYSISEIVRIQDKSYYAVRVTGFTGLREKIWYRVYDQFDKLISEKQPVDFMNEIKTLCGNDYADEAEIFAAMREVTPRDKFSHYESGATFVWYKICSAHFRVKFSVRDLAEAIGIPEGTMYSKVSRFKEMQGDEAKMFRNYGEFSLDEYSKVQAYFKERPLLRKLFKLP
jgi:hypothetical protein